MNLDSPERIRAHVKPHPWYGETIYLRRLSVEESRRLFKAREQMVRDEPVPEGEAAISQWLSTLRDDERDGWSWAALVLSKTLCDKNGALTHDTDEHRERLATKLNDEEIAELLTAALGRESQKKS